jgi:hypothetical protein
MKITIETIGCQYTWSNSFGAEGKPWPTGGVIDTTNTDEIVETFALLLSSAGYGIESIKNSMHEYSTIDQPND